MSWDSARWSLTDRPRSPSCWWRVFPSPRPTMSDISRRLWLLRCNIFRWNYKLYINILGGILCSGSSCHAGSQQRNKQVCSSYLKCAEVSSSRFSDTLVGSDLVRPTLMGQTQTNGVENTQVISKYFCPQTWLKYFYDILTAEIFSRRIYPTSVWPLLRLVFQRTRMSSKYQTTRNITCKTKLYLFVCTFCIFLSTSNSRIVALSIPRVRLYLWRAFEGSEIRILMCHDVIVRIKY